jgi:hypothetical protein
MKPSTSSSEAGKEIEINDSQSVNVFLLVLLRLEVGLNITRLIGPTSDKTTPRD